MTRKERIRLVLDHFSRTMDATETELHYGTTFQLLVAVVLSAQCTDKRVNLTTPALFERFPDAASMALASPEELFEIIRSISYPNAKARHLSQMAQMLVAEYGGKVPEAMEDLVRLPGVGRKTANVVQAVAFHKAALAVDTHVYRVSHRLGLVPPSARTPYAVEMALRRYIPEQQMAAGHYWLLLHGRYTCQARRPKCEGCALQSLCPTFKKTQDLKA